MKEIEVIISGRVQMVFFRDFTRKEALSLGLSGTTQNLPDGSVKVIAQGDEEALLQYIELLHKGSDSSHVENVSVSWQNPREEYNGFEIVR